MQSAPIKGYRKKLKMTTMNNDFQVLVIDHGLFCGLAETLVPHFGKVAYAPIWSQGLPTYHVADIGKGLPGVEHVEDAFKLLDRADKANTLLVFPDIFDAGWQMSLRKQGWRVWGSGYADELEIHRLYFKRMLETLGLPVPEYEVVTGVAKLREFLKAHEGEEWFVKLSSKLRGIKETFGSEGAYWKVEPTLDDLERNLGMKKRETLFIVEKKIPTKLEVGCDTFTVDGQFPEFACNGLEMKDAAYACVVQRWKDLPEEIRESFNALAPVLAKYQDRNCLSNEIRIAEDGTPYCIDLTCRFPSPAGECEQMLIGNLGQVMWGAAEGKMVQPEFIAPYAVEAIICGEFAEDQWQGVEYPDAIRQWVKLYFHRRESGHDFTMPQKTPMKEVGAVVGIGNTLKEAEAACKQHAEQITGHKLHIKIDSIAEASKEMALMEKAGFNLTPFNA